MTEKTDDKSAGKCPVANTILHRTNREWWPNQLNLQVLHQHSTAADPLGEAFDYAKEFKSLDLDAVVKDLHALMTDFAGLVARRLRPLRRRFSFAWRGTARAPTASATDAAAPDAAQQRFAPLNSWPDNVNLDKARRLLWPIKQKYGQKISWADLIILPATSPSSRWASRPLVSAAAAPTPGSPKRTSIGAPKASGWRTSATAATATSRIRSRAVQMGLIYVNPEGPNGKPDPLAAARDIRETFERMAMNDEETVALIAGGHRFGKTHGAADPHTTSVPSRKAPPSRSRASAGRAHSAAAKAMKPSAAAWRSPGPPRRPSGATTSSKTCSATIGS